MTINIFDDILSVEMIKENDIEKFYRRRDMKMESGKLFRNVVLPIIGSYILGYLYVRSMLITTGVFATDRAASIGVLTFTIVLLTGAEYVCQNVRRNKAVFFWNTCVVLIALSFVLEVGPFIGRGMDSIIIFFMLFMLHVLAVYAILVRGNWLVGEEASGYLLLDLLNGMIIIPCCNFILRMRMICNGIKVMLRQRMEKKSLYVGISVLAGAGAFLIYAISLLSNADDNFGKIFENILFSFTLSEFWLEQIFFVVLSLPVGAYLFGLVMGGLVNKTEVFNREKIEACMQKWQEAPSTILTIALVMFCGVYGIYLWLQGGYFFSAFMGNLPEEFTFAEYARQGFFELCRIIGLNIFLFWIVVKISELEIHKTKSLRVMLLIFHVQGLLFVATACSKVVLYIYAYGFTAMRVMSLWAISILLGAVVLAIAYMFGVKNVVKKWLYFMAVTLTLVCYM